MRFRRHRTSTWSTSLPLLLAFFACGSLCSRASGEGKLAVDATEVTREVTFRIEGMAPRSTMLHHHMSVGAKTALIAVLSAVVFGMLVLIRGFGLSTHIVPQSACVTALVLLAGAGIGAVCTLMGHPTIRLDRLAGNSLVSDEVSRFNYKSVYIAVVEGEGSPDHNLHPGGYVMLETEAPKGRQLTPGCRLSVVVDADTSSEMKANLGNSSIPTVATQ